MAIFGCTAVIDNGSNLLLVINGNNNNISKPDVTLKTNPQGELWLFEEGSQPYRLDHTIITDPQAPTDDALRFAISNMLNSVVGSLSGDLFFAISMGKVPGLSAQLVAGENPAVGNTFSDLWDFAGETLSYPIAPETWTASSTSENDKVGGTGAQSLTVHSLDEEWNPLTTIVPMDGTTPVIINNMHIRHRQTMVTEWGSSGINEGTITIVSGANNRARINIGLNNSLDGHYSVPNGKVALLSQFMENTSKNNDLVIRPQFRLFGSKFYSLPTQSIYEGTMYADFSKSMIPLPSKTDIKTIAKSNNENSPVTVSMLLTEVDFSLVTFKTFTF